MQRRFGGIVKIKYKIIYIFLIYNKDGHNWSDWRKGERKEEKTNERVVKWIWVSALIQNFENKTNFKQIREVRLVDGGGGVTL